MPGDVLVKKKADITAPDGPQTDGMIRMPAIVDKSDQICGTGEFLYAAIVTHDTDAASDGRQTTLFERRSPPWRGGYAITARFLELQDYPVCDITFEP
jgi:hypothetical protein